jgi:hypothetical protein
MEKFCKLVLAAVAFSTFTSVAMAQSRADLLTMNPEVRALVASIEKNRSVKCQTRLEETKQDEYGKFKIYTYCYDASHANGNEGVEPDLVIEMKGSFEKDHFQLTDVSIADIKAFREQLNK